MAVNGGSYVLACGSADGFLELRALWNLEELLSMDLSAHGGITTLSYSAG